MSGPDNASTPRKRATQTLEEMITRFSSPAQKRIALRKALQNHPNDERLQKEMLRLIGPDQIQQAVSEGVFISYSRTDELFALDLADQLNASGIAAWLDTVEVPEDHDWDAEVQAALERSGLMIAILSPHALEDEALRNEHRRFQEQGKLIFPVIHQHCDWPKLDFWLPAVDFTNDFERGLHTLLRALHGNLPMA